MYALICNVQLSNQIYTHVQARMCDLFRAV